MKRPKKEKEMKVDIPTLVKWAGGKKQLISQLIPLLPRKINNYYEPFAGGGAVALFLSKYRGVKKQVLSDVNEDLILAYQIINKSANSLINALKEYQQKHNKEFYYLVRDVDPSTLDPIKRTARFIYLNKTCFNGLHRVNSKGKFNVPIGSYKNPNICNEKDIKEISKLTKEVTFRNESFENVLKYAKKGDFIYFDPPYYPLNKASFTTYAKTSFLDEEQKTLAKTFGQLDKRGCNVMLSNSDTAFIRNLYKNYYIHTVHANRMINSNAKARGKVKEIVVTNYQLAQAILERKTEAG